MILLYIGLFHLMFPLTMSVMIPFMEWLFKGDIGINQKLIYKIQAVITIILITICIVVSILKIEGNL